MVASLVLAVSLATAPAAVPAPPLTLADAVAQARRASPARAGAAAIVEGAETAWRLSGRLPNPFIDIRGENWGAPANDALVPGVDFFAVVTQPIEIGGKRGVRRDLALADRDVATLALRSVERQIALDTVRAYMHALRARQILETLAADREGLQTLVETTHRRVKEGYAAESDLLRFQAEAARRDAELARTRLDLSRSLAELAALLGSSEIDPARLDEPPAPAALALLPEEAVRTAVRSRTDLQFARSRHTRALRLADVERLRRLPDPAISAGYKRTGGLNTGVAGVVVAVPLFDQNGQAIARARSEASAAGFDAAALEERAIAEARAIVAAAVTLADRAARVERDLLAPAEGVRNAARATFREGATDVLKLVDAERVYGEVRREALAIRTDAYIATIEARFALGQEDIP